MPVAKKTVPSDVWAVPEVGAVVERYGWGALDADGLLAYAGRDGIWAGHTSAGIGVFAKKIDGADAAERFKRARSFTRLPQSGRGVPSPACLGSDAKSRVLIFELLEGASSGSDLARDGLFTRALACKSGRIVGILHRTPATVAAGVLDTSTPTWPRLDRLTLSADVVAASSGAQQELYGIVQKNPALVDAVTSLAESSLQAPKSPVHCDLRLDRFLLHRGKLRLVDWEELRLADPARDVGAFVGEWLHRSIRAIHEGGSPTEQEIIRRGMRELERIRPVLDAFWTGYLATVDTPDPGLAPRAAGYAGWHVLDRVLAASRERARLHPVDRAAIRIADRILRTPGAFCDVLGLSAPVPTTTPARPHSSSTIRGSTSAPGADGSGALPFHEDHDFAPCRATSCCRHARRNRVVKGGRYSSLLLRGLVLVGRSLPAFRPGGAEAGATRMRICRNPA